VTNVFDVVIIGAGPAGLAAAVYTGRARLQTLILEKGVPGGQILLTDWVENYPGFPQGVVPLELIENFRKHAEKFGAKIEVDEARDIRKEENRWLVIGNKSEYLGRAIIIATGSSYRKLGLPNEERFGGKGISYCATCDAAFFREREVAVVGGGDNALTEALFLTKYSKKVTIIHRRDKFRAERILQERAFSTEKIEVLWNSTIEAINGKDRLETITIRNLKENKTFIRKIDGLFVSIGMDPNSSFLRNLLELNEWGQIKVGPDMATSQPGIFAAGDVTDACPRQMATAVGSGVSAALAVDEYLSA